ncbi:cytochrome P450 hydroxylase [Kitasatospora sp. NE20-6]|uniref:cytochrome P450 n=1 Tax=Kitasatospora sp. NE20-6 TaxID=2859066 RepID=UPI0034DC53A2
MTTLPAQQHDTDVDVTSIPHLDPPSYLPEVGSSGPFRTVRLPSGHETVHLTRYADVQKAFVSPDLSRALANTAGGPSFYPIVLPSTLLLTLDPPQHGRIKSLVSASFALSALNSKQAFIQDTVNGLLDELATGEVADLGEQFAVPLISRVLCDLLGVPDEAAKVFELHTPRIQKMGLGDAPNPAESVDAMVEYLSDVVGGRSPYRPDGLIAHILDARTRTPDITDEYIVGLLLLIVVAGDQSVVSVFLKGLYTLMSAPSLWHQLVSEPTLAPGFVEEFLGLFPLGYIPSLPRVAVRDVELPGGLVRAGQAVFPDGFAANRDPEVFDRPTVLDPRRGARHLGFGHGIHHCLGSALARMEMVTALQTLAERLPDLRAAGPLEDLAWHSGWLLRRPVELPVRWS